MTTTLAISGKGGSGKTTVAAMIIRLLCGHSSRAPALREQGAVLAVDADPNACLGLTMGVEPEYTIAELRESAREKSPTNAGTDRVRSFEYGIQQAITEAAGFDLLTMGRPEGPSCYCAVNNILRQFLDRLGSQYGFVIIDNEAGMEHLSRRTTNNVDLLCIVAEQTPLGELTARRILALAKQLPISVSQIGVIWNRTDSFEKLDDIETFGCVPYDDDVFNASMQGKTIFDIEENNPALAATKRILEQKLLKVRVGDS
jgi:CO dehydrogenase maturation factor